MTIAVLFGSRSPEHDVSIITGTLIIKGLKKLGHTVLPVYIDKNGEWYISEKLGELDFFKSPNFNSELKSLKEYKLILNKHPNKLVFSKSALFKQEEIVVDLVFPAFHGQNGEDGSIQGMLEFFNVAYVGCGVLSSSITIDKIWTKLLYQRFNIPTTKFIHFTKHLWLTNNVKIVDDVKSNFAWPVFVKPARLGSSIGIAKVKSEEELENAIEVALHYDEKVIVEESVEDLMDITVAVKGAVNPIASLIQESDFSTDFFSYDDKYLKEGGAQTGNAEKRIIIPARLDEKITEEIRKTAVEIYKIFECSGIARIDFLYNKTFKKYYANEINTLPGTLYHHLWKASGVSFEELLTELIDVALESYKKKNSYTYTFKSEILSKAGTAKGKLFD